MLDHFRTRKTIQVKFTGEGHFHSNQVLPHIKLLKQFSIRKKATKGSDGGQETGKKEDTFNMSTPR